MYAMNVPMQDSDNPYDNGYKNLYDKKKSKNWRDINPIGWRCTCRVFHMVIPPSGVIIDCLIHGKVFIAGKEPIRC